MFSDNSGPGVGAVRNAACVGRAIELHPDEPDDDLSLPFRLLRYAPAVVWVEPLESPVPLGKTCGPEAPDNCMPMFLTHATSSSPIVLPKDEQPFINGERIASYICTRWGFKLGDGFCVTDYYAQGLSFRKDTWFAHLCKPHRGTLERASVLVTLSRYAGWDSVLAWAPLWPSTATEEEINVVINAFHHASKPSDDLLADMRRIDERAKRTRDAYPAHLRAMVDELHPM